jgi:hypothetical protein
MRKRPLPPFHTPRPAGGARLAVGAFPHPLLNVFPECLAILLGTVKGRKLAETFAAEVNDAADVRGQYVLI